MLDITARDKLLTNAVLLLVLLIPGAAAGEAWTQPRTRVEEPISIVPARAVDAVDGFAAQELQRYLRAVTGHSVVVGEKRSPHRIFLGGLPQAIPDGPAQRLRNDLNSLGEDGFVVRRIGPDIVILGKGPRGVRYGCYALLEHFGVRWFFPGKDYEVVPRRQFDWRAPIDIVESPAIKQRIIFYYANSCSPIEEWVDFAGKLRVNCLKVSYNGGAEGNWYIDLRSHLRPELEKRGLTLEVGGHMLSSFLPRSLFKGHPDWFRMDEHGRRVNDFNLNPFNAEAVEYLTSGAAELFSKTPEAAMFHAWADDIEGGGWSHEPGKEDYTPSDQALLVYNELAKRLRQRLPEAKVPFLAYQDTLSAPRVVKPGPGVVFLYAPRERCYSHALDDPACSLNQKYRRALEEALPSFGSANAEVFEYYVDEVLYQMTKPPLPDVLSADADYYHRLGIPGVGALLDYTTEYATPMVNMFLYPRALWNPRADLRALLADYATVYFGDPSLANYFRSLEEGLNDVLKTCKYSHPGTAWYSFRVDKENDEALAWHVQAIEEALSGPLPRANALLQAAVRTAKNRQYRERLRRESWQMEFTLGQIKLYYHLLKCERLYRDYKHHADAAAALRALQESVLARFWWESQRKLTACSGLKGNFMGPDPAALQNRVDEILNDGYTMEGLDDILFGFTILGGPPGSSAVLWNGSDVRALHSRLRDRELEWRDEFGQPLGSTTLASAPAVVAAWGIADRELFDMLASSM